MKSIIEQAGKGNEGALKELFSQAMNKTLAFCRACIQDRTKAEETTLAALTTALKRALAGTCSSEEDFQEIALKQAGLLCRKPLLRKKDNSLPVPKDKNFVIAPSAFKTLDLFDSAIEQFLFSLPDLQRYLFALHRIAGFDESKIAIITGYRLSVIAAALKAEEMNTTHLAERISTQMGLTVNIENELQRFIETSEPSEAFSAELDSLIHSRTEALHKRKKRKLAWLIGAAALVCVLAITCICLYSQKQADNTADYDFSEPEIIEEETEENAEEVTETDTVNTDESEQSDEQIYADIEIADYGTITVVLDYDTAPTTVDNFINLAESGFYDGLTFHRIIEGFMMQGGDPNGDGTGGAEETIPGEFSANGYENNLSHTRGAISMARSSDYDSASSQFFIVQEDSTYLDGEYAVFGYVTEGMEIVDNICSEAEPTDSNGSIAADAQPIITTISIRYTGDASEQE